MSTIAERIQELSTRLIGAEAHYEGEKGKRKVNLDGVITEVEFAGCQITNARGSWLGIRLRIKPKGRGAVWTFPMADEFA